MVQSEKSKKKRNTVQKELIYKCFSAHTEKHLTAEQIEEYLKKSNTPVGMATIYRAIKSFLKEGFIRQYGMMDGSASYQIIKSDECFSHYHLQCDSCGKVMHAEKAIADKLSGEIQNGFDFDIDVSKTVFHGKCKNCRMEEKNQ